MDHDPDCRTTRDDLGFTLVEVLVSISLFAVALTLLMGGFRFTSRAWDAGERVIGHTADLATVHRVLNNMVDRFFPVSLKTVEQEGYAFSGSDDRLRFSAQLPPHPAVGGLYTVEFTVNSDNDKDRLELKIVPFDAETFRTGELETEEKSLLLETTGKISFSYFSGDSDEEWLAHWPEIEVPPQKVRLQFAESEKTWPDIVAPISIDMDHACAFPEQGGECRLDL